MQREKRHRIISLDPNVRPIVISDLDAYRQRFEGGLGCVDILRLSEADLNLLFPGESVENLFPNWFALGVSLVVLTRGSAGAEGNLPDGNAVSVSAHRVQIRDTVGTGDTFFAATLTYLHGNSYLSDRTMISQIPLDDLEACLSLGSKAAAINCTRDGADPPYRHEMDL